MLFWQKIVASNNYLHKCKEAAFQDLDSQSSLFSTSLQIGGYDVPKGTLVHISSYSMHHDERWWQDADAFKPERWIGDETGGDRTGGLAYLPFGVGPRMCIGIKLAGTCIRQYALHIKIMSS